ncbi:MAG: TatD family hydrolase [Chromatiales bacterium]|nr:TatD family hydrolase [Chromatiales bacterium]
MSHKPLPELPPLDVPLVDSHCHLDMLRLEGEGEDMARVLATASGFGVGKMLCVSVNLEDWPAMMRIVEAHDQVSASVGVHPNHSDCLDPGVAELVAMAAHPKVVAIGETGLDYFRSEGDLDWQRDRFRRHIEAARQTALPLIIHTRDAREDTLRILEEENARDVGGVMHCFAEDWETAERALDIGFYISFSGIVTFKNAEMLKDVARRVPLDRMLVETDSPYLSPVPLRGRQNEPGFTRFVAEHIAELRGDSVDNIARATTENFHRLFTRAA